jgi:hypothetical protein
MSAYVLKTDNVSNVSFDFEPELVETDRAYDEKMAASAKKKKPEVCLHWLRGLCHDNDIDCDRWHKFDPEMLPICTFFQSGQCNNPDCIFRHPRDEEEDIICVAYAQGFCKKGKKCTEHHIQRTMRDIINVEEYAQKAVDSHRRAQERAHKNSGQIKQNVSILANRRQKAHVQKNRFY